MGSSTEIFFLVIASRDMLTTYSNKFFGREKQTFQKIGKIGLMKPKWDFNMFQNKT